MQVPEGILENTGAALALLSAVLAAGGLLLCIGAYAASFFALQSAEKAVMPQFDSASAALSGAQAVASSAAQSVDSASLAIGNVSAAFAGYADSAGSLSDSLGTLAAVPPFSLDPKIASSAARMKEASQFFSGAASSLNSSASQAGDAAAGAGKMADNLGNAVRTLEESLSSVKSAFGMLNAAALVFSLCLFGLFSSVLLISASVLLQHYPRLFDRKKEKG